FQDNFMGPDGLAPAGVTGDAVSSGYFAFNAPGVLPAWWPAGLPGFRIHANFAGGIGTTLRRGLGQNSNPGAPFDALTLPSDVTDLMNLIDFNTYTDFRQQLEAGTRLHNFIHNWIGGHMRLGVSPNDPMFFMHHANIDRLWAMWQVNGHSGPAHYSGAGSIAATAKMWPWVGVAGWTSPALQNIGYNMPLFPAITYGDVLDHRALGYSYDSEVVFGVALDQSFSMTGNTPIIVSGMELMPKWDAAKTAIGNLFHDAEVAQESVVAYCTGGVQAFTTDLGANVFTDVFSPESGIIKNGAPHSEANFTANVAGLAPLGGTPIAGALTSTENEIVRPPFANQPANDTRYMYFLTDGLETAQPPLSSLAAGHFANTIIFAMGFGMGGGWNGINESAIHDIAHKGKTAPPAVPHHFLADSLPALDKFFTDSLAAALNFGAAIDPIYELYPGEHADTPFTATTADRSFMIAVLGYDLSDGNWRVTLIGPDQTEYEAATKSPVLIHRRTHNGRTTIFLRRNAATEGQWIGTWNVRVERTRRRRGPRFTYPVKLADLLQPSAAPPLSGALFATAQQPVKSRISPRTLGVTDLIAAPPEAPTETPCTVTVNIYAQSQIEVTLDVGAKDLVAGADFDVRLTIGGVAKLENVRVLSRLIAPRFSLGNAFVDLQTMPRAERSKFLVKKRNRPELFDEAAFAAEYEKRKPGAFPVRDEPIALTEKQGVWRGRVTKNLFPGVHHVSALVEGTYIGPSGRRESFVRTVSARANLGIQVDPKASEATFFWTAADTLTVRVVPRDALGNVASPARLAPPELHIGGKRVKATVENPFTGEFLYHVKLKGRGIEIDPTGARLARGTATIELEDGTAELRANEPIRAEMILMGINRIVVQQGTIVADVKRRRAFAAGDKQAMKIDADNRRVFTSREEAEREGFAIE
ncbi:MAG TPA: tyrosinase family protein, partial [Thermoanaerobaculia bacterium]